MKTVSNAYKTSMASLLRERSYVKIGFENIDVDATEDGVWTTNSSRNYSEFDTLETPYLYTNTIASLELNRWSLDGKSTILPSDLTNVHDGYVCYELSDGNTGSFNDPPFIDKLFDEPHDIVGLTLTFDVLEEEFPQQITVLYYNSNTILKSMTVYPKDLTVVIDEACTNVTKVRIRFEKVLPLRRARIQQIRWGVMVEFTNADILSTSEHTDIDPLSRRLPDEQFSFTILDYDHKYDPDNPDGVYQYIDVNAPIVLTYGYDVDGEIEWLEPDNYLLTAKPTTQNNQATFTATGYINSLHGIYYKSKLGTKTFYDMAEDVLLDANLPLTPTLSRPWVIDPSLRNMTTTAVLPIDTHMNCLQLIAHACRCKLYTDSNNIIHITPFTIPTVNNTGYVLDFNAIKENSQVITKIEELKEIQVSKSIYSANSGGELFKETTTRTNLHVEFDSLVDNLDIYVSSGLIISTEVYGRAVDLVLSTGTKTVTISGDRITESSVVISYPISLRGEIDVEDNPLITSDSMCQALATHVADYLSLRNTYDAEYRGNPELEVGDVIGLQTLYTDNMNAMILVDDIQFNGALSGKLKVKGLI